MALNLLDSPDADSLRVIFSDAQAARELLKTAEVAFTESQVLAVELPSPDALADIAATLLTAEVRLLMAYPLFITVRGNSVVRYTWRIRNWRGERSKARVSAYWMSQNCGQRSNKR